MKSLLSLIFGLLPLLMYAGEISECRMHEAYLCKENDQIILQAIAKEPPKESLDKPTPQNDSTQTWIPGYWAWSWGRGDFIWVSGLWRMAPPDCHWIAGYWSSSDKGWVWYPGFWYRGHAKNALTYLEALPPERKEEAPKQSLSTKSFWINGYWQWDQKTYKYAWYKGEWLELDPRWVYMPSRYYWREEGYLFIPSYWDWNLEKRGTLYPCFAAENRALPEAYLPTKSLESSSVLKSYFLEWPDYALFYHHYSYFHPSKEFQPKEFQLSIITPPWWGWNSWWALSWHDLWWLWWWWTHPGFVAPPWISFAASESLPKPSSALVQEMKKRAPPQIVTNYGVFSQTTLSRVHQEVTGSKEPIFSADAKELSKMHSSLELIREGRGQLNLRPEGRVENREQMPARQSEKEVRISVEREAFQAPKGKRIQTHLDTRLNPAQYPEKSLPSGGTNQFSRRYSRNSPMEKESEVSSSGQNRPSTQPFNPPHRVKTHEAISEPSAIPQSPYLKPRSASPNLGPPIPSETGSQHPLSPERPSFGPTNSFSPQAPAKYAFPPESSFTPTEFSPTQPGTPERSHSDIQGKSHYWMSGRPHSSINGMIHSQIQNPPDYSK